MTAPVRSTRLMSRPAATRMPPELSEVAGRVSLISRGARSRSPQAVAGLGSMLRREGYDGPVTMISADDSPPVDRPNLSKDYLAGTAKEDWIPLRAPEYFAEQRIELVLNTRVSSLDLRARQIVVDSGTTYAFDALLVATGADPVHLDIPGATNAQVRYLRTFADSKAIVGELSAAKRVLVAGASFIGLEVAASLRTQNVDVHDATGPQLVRQRAQQHDGGTGCRAAQSRYRRLVVPQRRRQLQRSDGRWKTGDADGPALAVRRHRR